MKRMEKREQEHQMKTLKYINLIFIFIAIASVTYGCSINDENIRIKEKIEKYNSEVKVYYLQQDIEGGKY